MNVRLVEKRSQFSEVLGIRAGRVKANRAVNVALIDTYWAVSEYAVSRHISPVLVAECETRLIPKPVLEQRLHEWSLMLEAPDAPGGGGA
jgi:hypothetical protein